MASWVCAGYFIFEPDSIPPHHLPVSAMITLPGPAAFCARDQNNRQIPSQAELPPLQVFFFAPQGLSFRIEKSEKNFYFSLRPLQFLQEG